MEKSKTITFEGIEHEYRVLNYGSDFNYNIAKESLKDSLYKEDGTYKSKIAEDIEEFIEFFVSDESFNLTDEELAKVIFDPYRRKKRKRYKGEYK